MEIPYGKYVDSNINHDHNLPLSTEIVPYKAIKIDDQNIDHTIHVIDHTIQHAIVEVNQRYTNRNIQIEFIKCKCDPNLVKWVIISTFTMSIVFVFITPLFSN